MKTPQPATVISTIALIFAATGTAVAAVSYATNAGAVDGKSAVAHGASSSAAAGRLVAAQKSGSDKGRIAERYLARGLARSATFGRRTPRRSWRGAICA
jgi:hypothetical protein